MNHSFLMRGYQVELGPTRSLILMAESAQIIKFLLAMSD